MHASIYIHTYKHTKMHHQSNVHLMSLSDKLINMIIINNLCLRTLPKDQPRALAHRQAPLSHVTKPLQEHAPPGPCFASGPDNTQFNLLS